MKLKICFYEVGMGSEQEGIHILYILYIFSNVKGRGGGVFLDLL